MQEPVEPVELGGLGGVEERAGLVDSEYCGGTLTSGVVVTVGTVEMVGSVAMVVMDLREPICKYTNTLEALWSLRWE